MDKSLYKYLLQNAAEEKTDTRELARERTNDIMRRSKEKADASLDAYKKDLVIQELQLDQSCGKEVARTRLKLWIAESYLGFGIGLKER